MEADSQRRLRRHLDATDDDALIALANRGLVRRAKKDLEQAGALAVEETDDCVIVRGTGWAVQVPPEGPTAASDDTSATGITRQILTAILHLRDHWQPSPSANRTGAGDTVDPVAEIDSELAGRIATAEQLLVEVGSESLAKWSGRTPLLEAAQRFEREQHNVVIQRTPQLTLHFEHSDIHVRLMTDRPATIVLRLLDQFRCTAPKSEQAVAVLMAVLALKQDAGKSVEVRFDSTAISDAVREDRQSVADRVKRLLRAFAATGIAHPSSRMIQRTESMCVAAEAARFPRLARLLTSIADDIALQIARSAKADLSRLTQRIATAYALVEATSRSTTEDREDLFGRFRSAYQPAGSLTVSGLGASGWRTASGFEGITLFFWAPQLSRIVTATAARGTDQDPNFSIDSAWNQGLGWRRGTTIAEMCRRQIALADARINAAGRLSTADSCTAQLQDVSVPDELDLGDKRITDWTLLPEIVAQSQPFGLRLPDPRDALVVLRPAEWGDRWFDELQQALVWLLHDDAGHTVRMEVPWSTVDEQTILFLESCKVRRDGLVEALCRVEQRGNRLTVYPITLFSTGGLKDDRIFCPQFDRQRIRSGNQALIDRLREKFKRNISVETRISLEDDVQEATAADLAWAPPIIRTLLVDLDNIVLSALESGTVSPAAAKSLPGYERLASDLNLTELADAIHALADAHRRPGAAMLRTLWRLHLARQALAGCVATFSPGQS